MWICASTGDCQTGRYREKSLFIAGQRGNCFVQGRVAVARALIMNSVRQWPLTRLLGAEWAELRAHLPAALVYFVCHLWWTSQPFRNGIYRAHDSWYSFCIALCTGDRLLNLRLDRVPVQCRVGWTAAPTEVRVNYTTPVGLYRSTGIDFDRSSPGRRHVAR